MHKVSKRKLGPRWKRQRQKRRGNTNGVKEISKSSEGLENVYCYQENVY